MPSLWAHSVEEIHLYLMVRPCDRCAGGPLRAQSDRTGQLPDSGEVQVSARCDACGKEHALTFELPPGTAVDERDDLYASINPGDEPSRIIDVGQWMTLFRIILEAASNEGDKIEARRLGLEAAQCLEEAIKFYHDDELPPADAVFCESTRHRLREHPQQFARQRLVDMRAKLPTTSQMQGQVRRDAERSSSPKRPWWKRWRR